MLWDFIGSPGTQGNETVRGNETADRLARSGSACVFVGPEPALGALKRDLSSNNGRWLANQHHRQWRDLGHSQRQARELISGHQG
jgi:hypothetical protein